jgi:hypothetical protein
LPCALRFERLSLEGGLDAEGVARCRTDHDKHESTDHHAAHANLGLLDRRDRCDLFLVLEHPLLLGSARLGAFLQLNAELRLLGFTHAALFLFAVRVLLRQPDFIRGPPPGLLFLASLLRGRFRPPSCVFGRSEPCLFFSRDARLLKRMQL